MTCAGAGESAASALSRLTESFRAAGVEEPHEDARLLLCAAASLTRVDLIVRPDILLDEHASRRLDDWMRRRLKREPVTRILGRRGFWSVDLGVAADVLDPRPDTETLVEAVLRALPSARSEPLRILDAGTGSGAILAALLSEFVNATGVAVDVSPAACAAAGANFAALGIGDRTVVLQQSWDAPLPGSFDVIVSNPPYIASGEIAGLAPEVSLYDPRLALDGGPDGLDAYRSICAALPGWTKPGALVAVEIGSTQATTVSAIFASVGLERLEVRRDAAGLERVIVARAPAGE